jgi:hypothetical protein
VHHFQCIGIVRTRQKRSNRKGRIFIVLEKLTRGVLHVSFATGLSYVQPTLKERVRLLWLFRNFRILPYHVLPPRQKAWISALCEDNRLHKYNSFLDREIASLIGTIVLAEPSVRSAREERRRAPRLPMHFEVRYGGLIELAANADRSAKKAIKEVCHSSSTEMFGGDGCDLSETGVAFSGPRTFPVGTELTVHFRLVAGSRESWVRTRATIRNVDGKRMGAEFLIIHPRDRAQLRQLTVAKADTEPTANEAAPVS